MFEFFKRFFLILFFALLCLPLKVVAVNNDGSRYAQNSVLSNGKWYKIKIPETGVYKLTYDDLKNKIGLSNPADVKIFGYGGWILDEDFSKTYVDDLPKVSIWMSSKPENFGKNDYILFYGRGDIKWEYNTNTKEFEQTQNPYSSESYYFVTEATEPPVLMQTEASLEQTSNVVTTFSDYVLHETESKNIGQSGRVFYGEDFSSKTSREFILKTEGVTADPATVRYDFVYYTTFPGGQTLTASLNGTQSTPVNTVAITGSKEKDFTFGKAINEAIISTNLQTDNKVVLSYNNKVSSDKNLYLNYIRINYKRLLKSYGAVTLFRDVDNTGDNLTYKIADANSLMIVFDVTDNNVVKQLETQLNGSTLSFTESNSPSKEYALIDLNLVSKIPTPTLSSKDDSRVGKIDNQNLHALSGYDMIIIVQPFLETYANELAKLHEEDSGLKSLVITPEAIYNEFSSGKPDVTAYRRFLKMFYDRAEGGDNRPQYLLLFGGGTYDNRLLNKAWTDEEKKSMLLTYQSKNSLMETLSYTTDDYLGFLDDADGSSVGSDAGENFLDKCVLRMNIGRLPVRTKQQAADVVSKITNYINNDNKGIWQNNILYVADDLIGSKDNTNESTFITDAETLAKYSNDNYPNFITNKIYEDAYERVIEANGARYPAATSALLDKIDRGTLVLNFIGHGSVSSWTHENLLTYSDIEGLKNDNLGLWITATCDFSRFDADSKSSGELAFLQKTGGAIALYSTVRTAYISDNTKINNNINNFLLERDQEGKPLRIGDIMRKAKSESDMATDGNKLRFALLGDPALRLAFPDSKYTVEVMEMNGKEASDNNINIEALGNNVIIGHIVDASGEVVTNFNGTLESVIFDSEQDLRTRGNKANGTADYDRGTDYKSYTNTLFTGKVEVVNGIFRIEFVAPKDILYADTKGKMSFFAYDKDGINEAQGSFFNYTVGGTNIDFPDDFDGPVIEQIYLNKDNFKSGDRVNPTPLFYAKVSDASGINVSGSIGHDMTLTIDGNTDYNLTPYFENQDNSSKQGTVSFRIPELTLGTHYFQFRVWDVANNSTTSELINFVVTDDAQATSYGFEIWGNPAKDKARFVFKTDVPNENVSIKLSVYTLAGQMIWTYNANGDANSLSEFIYDWNLTTNGGGRVPPGVYICNAQVIVNGKVSSMKSEKLIVASY